MLKDYTIEVLMMNDVKAYKTIEGYGSESAAMNVVISEMNTNNGLKFDDGLIFIPARMIKCMTVILDG